MHWPVPSPIAGAAGSVFNLLDCADLNQRARACVAGCSGTRPANCCGNFSAIVAADRGNGLQRRGDQLGGLGLAPGTHVLVQVHEDVVERPYA